MSSLWSLSDWFGVAEVLSIIDLDPAVAANKLRVLVQLVYLFAESGCLELTHMQFTVLFRIRTIVF